jgi:hypothetical protein
MRVRIRFSPGLRVKRSRRKNRGLALVTGLLLMPATTMAAVLAAWRLAADMQWAREFAIRTGIFSHSQVWLICASVLHLFSRRLSRYGQDSGAPAA